MNKQETISILQTVFTKRQVDNLIANFKKQQESNFSIISGLSNYEPYDVILDADCVLIGCNKKGDRVTVIELNDKKVYTMDGYRLSMIANL